MARSRTFGEIKHGSMDETFAENKVDLLRSRVGLLRGKDRAMMKIYLENAGTFCQMARIAGVNEANIARRIHKIVRRLLDGQYMTCLRNRELFTQEQLEIARDYFVDGLPIGEIAWRRETTYYSIRRVLQKIQRLTRVTEEGGQIS